MLSRVELCRAVCTHPSTVVTQFPNLQPARLDKFSTKCVFNTDCRRDSTRQLSRVDVGGAYCMGTKHQASRTYIACMALAWSGHDYIKLWVELLVRNSKAPTRRGLLLLTLIRRSDKVNHATFERLTVNHATLNHPDHECLLSVITIFNFIHHKSS